MFFFQVITEKTPFVGDIIGISSFGIINAFSHVILKKNQIVNKKTANADMPQLILVSGRNEENVRETLKTVFMKKLKIQNLYVLNKIKLLD